MTVYIKIKSIAKRKQVIAGEAEFGSPISIKDGDEVTFIRLTMLAGRLW